MSLNPRPIREPKSKLDIYFEKVHKVQDQISKYDDRPGHRWWEFEDRNWEDDRQAEHDCDDMMMFISKSIDYESMPGASPSRDKLELKATKRYIKQHLSKRSKKQLANLAARLEDENYHLSAAYIRSVYIGGAPESLIIKKRNIKYQIS